MVVRPGGAVCLLQWPGLGSSVCLLRVVRLGGALCCFHLSENLFLFPSFTDISGFCYSSQLVTMTGHYTLWSFPASITSFLGTHTDLTGSLLPFSIQYSSLLYFLHFIYFLDGSLNILQSLSFSSSLD